jgi:hypothetical protein
MSAVRRTPFRSARGSETGGQFSRVVSAGTLRPKLLSVLAWPRQTLLGDQALKGREPVVIVT